MEWEPADNYVNIKNMCSNVKCEKFSIKLEWNGSISMTKYI